MHNFEECHLKNSTFFDFKVGVDGFKKVFCPFLTANNLLSKNQFAYRKLHSTVTSLLNVIDSWYSNIDRKKSTLAFSLI